MSDKICPMMTARVTSLSDPKETHPKLTPTVVMCRREDCAWWDEQNKACVVVAMLIELIKAEGD